MTQDLTDETWDMTHVSCERVMSHMNESCLIWTSHLSWPIPHPYETWLKTWLMRFETWLMNHPYETWLVQMRHDLFTWVMTWTIHTRHDPYEWDMCVNWDMTHSSETRLTHIGIFEKSSFTYARNALAHTHTQYPAQKHI